MKLIKIKHYSISNKTYKVPIGNGITRAFDSKKKALKFLADTNRFLNTKLHELNFIYSDVYLQYRRNWFYFDHHKSPGASLFALERTVRTYLSQTEETFDLICSRSGYENGNYFVFAHFKTIFNGLKAAIRSLQKLQKSKSSAVDIHKLQVLYDRIIHLENETYQFDGNVIQEIIDVDEVFTRNSMKIVS